MVSTRAEHRATREVRDAGRFHQSEEQCPPWEGGFHRLGCEGQRGLFDQPLKLRMLRDVEVKSWPGFWMPSAVCWALRWVLRARGRGAQLRSEAVVHRCGGILTPQGCGMVFFVFFFMEKGKESLLLQSSLKSIDLLVYGHATLNVPGLV